MKKTQIVKKNWEFQEIINGKKQLVSKSLILYFRKNDSNLRVGISISKKFANAVYRNKYRRQVRAVLDHLDMWDIKYDVILILRKGFLKLSFDKKINEVKKIIERLK